MRGPKKVVPLKTVNAVNLGKVQNLWDWGTVYSGGQNFFDMSRTGAKNFGSVAKGVGKEFWTCREGGAKNF